MKFTVKANQLRYSPYKLRLLADVIRGKDVVYALNWLSTCKMQRALPIEKALKSAVANAKNLQNIEADSLLINEIRVDQGPMFRYFKPGAMGRANPQTKRLSHLSIILKPKIINSSRGLLWVKRLIR